MAAGFGKETDVSSALYLDRWEVEYEEEEEEVLEMYPEPLLLPYHPPEKLLGAFVC